MPSNSGGIFSSRLLQDKKFIGLSLLVVVNILWVLSAEITRYIFVEENFKRPFFIVYVKSCMLIVYMIRYLSCETTNKNNYKLLLSDQSESDYEMSIESLSLEGFETMTEDSDVESCSDEKEARKRCIKFSSRKEVRRMPALTAEEQRQARLPYRPPQLTCSVQLTHHLKYTVFFFAPLWLLCSFTYQAALLTTTVSSLNLISSSSSVFLLAFAICFPSPTNRFTMFKAILVAMNMSGVILVSHFTPSLVGAFFAQISALSYAIYLAAFSHFEEKYGKLSINLMFGSIGLLALIVGTPLLNVMDKIGVEKLHPMPNFGQMSSIMISAVFGTLVADYLWLKAAGMCDSLTASLSLTLSIPFSFIADTVLRSTPPTTSELIAAVPIALSFVGAALSQNSSRVVSLRRLPAGSGIGSGRKESEEQDRKILIEDVDE